MNQQDLDRAVAKATQESVGVIAGFGFSLLSLPSTNPLAIPPQRRKYPLRLAHETRKRKPPRKQAKPSRKYVPAARSATKYSGTGSYRRSMQLTRLVRFDRGA